MSSISLEERVAKLEVLVGELRGQGAATDVPGRDEWKGTFGMFAGDPVMQEILEETQRIREADRRQAGAC